MRTALAMLAIGAALLAGARLLHHTAPPEPATAALRGQPMILGGTSPATRPARVAPNGAEREMTHRLTNAPRPATQAARRFMTAFLAWQHGRRDRPIRVALRATTSPTLWRALNGGASVPGTSTAIPAERLRELIPGTVNSGPVATVLAELERQHHVGGLALVLRHHRHGWRVTSLKR